MNFICFRIIFRLSHRLGGFIDGAHSCSVADKLKYLKIAEFFAYQVCHIIARAEGE